MAESLSYAFSDKNVTNLEAIAKFESLPVHYDDYENCFDGMLFYDCVNKRFHVHINNEKGNYVGSKRGRFTLAHELGHYFIDEHRLGLKYGLIEPHASFHNIENRTLIEEEADYFASILLMPKDKFKNHSIKYQRRVGRKVFSFATIMDLSETFQTSILSTLIRFGEVGTHEIFAVVSKENIAQWFVKSTDFPNWPFKFKRGQEIQERP